MTQYIIVAACVIAGLLLILKMGREKKIFYFVGAFLILLGGWLLADYLTDGLLSSGWFIWAGRAALLVVILVLLKIMRDENRASGKTKEEPGGGSDEENE